jgi:hypothetical protein
MKVSKHDVKAKGLRMWVNVIYNGEISVAEIPPNAVAIGPELDL